MFYWSLKDSLCSAEDLAEVGDHEYAVSRLVISPGMGFGKPGVWTKKVNTQIDLGCGFAELMQQEVQRGKGAESIGKRLGQGMDRVN